MKYAEMKERRVLITGGTQGIGEAMADLFSADGAKVVINGRVLNERCRRFWIVRVQRHLWGVYLIRVKQQLWCVKRLN